MELLRNRPVVTIKVAKRMRITLRGVVYREDSVWLAHCLEMDIVAEGATPEQALKDVIELCHLQLRVAREEGDIEAAFRPAPPEYWKLFFMAPKRRRAKAAAPIAEFEARELQFA